MIIRSHHSQRLGVIKATQILELEPSLQGEGTGGFLLKYL